MGRLSSAREADEYRDGGEVMRYLYATLVGLACAAATLVVFHWLDGIVPG